MKITLKQDHKHAGVTVKAGDSLTVAVQDYLWLRDRKIVASVVDATDAERAQIGGTGVDAKEPAKATPTAAASA